MTEFKSIIFYGAGYYATENINRWEQNGLIPVCFCDADQQKHNKLFNVSGRREYKILPLDIALDKYAEYEIYITVSKDNFKSIYEYLISYGIKKESIKHPDFIFDGKPKHCPSLGKQMFVNGISLHQCCFHSFATYLKSSGNIETDYKQWSKLCKDLNYKMSKGEICRCTGCPELMDGASEPFQFKLGCIGVGCNMPGGERCNSKCIYCGNFGHSKEGKLEAFGYSVLDVLHWVSENFKTEEFIFSCTGGEITVSSQRDEIIEFWKEKKFKGAIATNGFIYNQGIADLLHSGIGLNCSLDAGTAETYYKIKGVNCFEKTVDNLEKYAEASINPIYLKYIILEGINDNEVDIYGFFKIASKLHATVILSTDYRKPSKSASQEEVWVAKLFRELCDKNNLLLDIKSNCNGIEELRKT